MGGRSATDGGSPEPGRVPWHGSCSSSLRAHYRHRTGLFITGEAGATVDPNYSPVWSVHVEPGFAFSNGLVVRLKYWRLQFTGTGAHVLSPSLTCHLGRWTLHGRYYLSFDDVRGVGHTAVVKAAVRVAGRWTFQLGDGGGTRADFIVPRESDTDRRLLGLAGVWLELGWRHRVQLDYVFRHETAGSASYVEKTGISLPGPQSTG